MSKDDRANLSRAGSMRPPPPPPPRFPLMTPSASPPVQRPFGRQSVGPPPTKKRRVSRTPSLLGPGARSLSVASGSSSSISPAFNFDASVDPEDLHAARRASSFRVLNVWSQLAGKYARRLDEDDIVDLRREAIIKDYGILRSSTDMFEIGCFAAEHEKAEQLDKGQPLTPVDDEPDELDAFAEIQDNVSRSETDGDEEDGFGLAQQSKRIPPVRELDPDDAADLAEFLKEEQARREMFGDPDEEEEVDEFEGTEDAEEGDLQESGIRDEEDVKENRSNDVASKSDTETDFTEHEIEEGGADYQESIDDKDDGDWHRRQDYRRLFTPSGSPEFDILGVSYSEKGSDNGEATDGINRASDEPLNIASDADSEDELGGWDRDEGSTLYSVGDYSEESIDEDVEERIQDRAPILTPGPSSSPRKGGNRANRQQTKSPGRTPAARVSLTSPSKKTSSRRVPSPTHVIQLQTPPRSTSFGPEVGTARITSTYSRKRRGTSFSPKKTPARIESTASGSSDSETEIAPTPSNKTRKVDESRTLPPQTPTRKARFVPEVYIDGPSRSSQGKPFEEDAHRKDSRVDSSNERFESYSYGKTAKGKDKARATVRDKLDVLDDLGREYDLMSEDVLECRGTSRDHVPQNFDQRDTVKRLSSDSKKRRPAYSPPLESHEADNTIDVVMASPRSSSSRKPSRRMSSSRRSIVIETDMSNEPEADGSRVSSVHRGQSRPSRDDLTQGNSRPAPQLTSFSFIPPQPPPVISPTYGSIHVPPPLPNFQDPNAQYHLAQALQSLSYLMGGALPFPPSPVTEMQEPSFPGGSHGQRPWPPYTPRHQHRHMNFETPQSAATAPPTSSPLGSDYSDSVPSSPTKQLAQDRGRLRTQSFGPKIVRPKSAMRESKTPSRSRSRSQRRVSFSSPEATQIEDYAYEVVGQDVIEVDSSEAEDNDFEQRRLRRENQSTRSSQLHSLSRHQERAQTPGPPSRRPAPEAAEKEFYESSHNDLEPRRKLIRDSRPSRPRSGASHHASRRERR